VSHNAIAIHLSRLRPLFNSSREEEPLPLLPPPLLPPPLLPPPDAETGEETDSSDSSESSETSDSDNLEHDVELSVCMKTCNKGNNLGSQGTLNFELSK
jgi:hypothetical protein